MEINSIQVRGNYVPDTQSDRRYVLYVKHRAADPTAEDSREVVNVLCENGWADSASKDCPEPYRLSWGLVLYVVANCVAAGGCRSDFEALELAD